MIIRLSISHQECRIIGWTAHTEEMTKFSGNVMTALQTALQVTLQSCHDCSSFIARSETSYYSKPQFLLCSLAHSPTHIFVYASNVSVHKLCTIHIGSQDCPGSGYHEVGIPNLKKKLNRELKWELKRRLKSERRRVEYPKANIEDTCGL
jgi:hypothetical protein